MCDQLQGDEIEVRALRLQRLSLGLSDAATAYVCGLPVFDELCEAIQSAVIKHGASEYVEGAKSVWAYLRHAATVSEHPQTTPEQREDARQIERAYVAQLAVRREAALQ